MKIFEVMFEGKRPSVTISGPVDQFADICVSRGEGGKCMAAKMAKMRGKDISCTEIRKSKSGNGVEICQPFAYWDVIQRARGRLTNRMKDQLRAVRLPVNG